MDPIEILVQIVQNAPDNVYLRIFYAIIVFISMIIGGHNMSKFAQTFSNMEQRFKFNQASGKVVEDPDGLTDCQAEIDSHKDETLSSFMDKYLPQIQLHSEFADLDDSDFEFVADLCANNRIDRYTAALNGLHSIREELKIPDHISDTEIVGYINEIKNGGDQSESTQNVEKSE